MVQDYKKYGVSLFDYCYIQEFGLDKTTYYRIIQWLLVRNG